MPGIECGAFSGESLIEKRCGALHVAWTTTKARVKQLLALNPYAHDPKNWPKLLANPPAGEDIDELTFMIAATWPDQIKRDITYQVDGTHDGNRPPTD